MAPAGGQLGRMDSQGGDEGGQAEGTKLLAVRGENPERGEGDRMVEGFCDSNLQQLA